MKPDDFPKITMDEPPVTFDDVVGWIRNTLAGVGIGALCAIIAFCAGYAK